MREVVEFFKKGNALHHAYLIEGDRAKQYSDIVAFLENDVVFPVHGNPDYWYGEYDRLGIDDGRALRDMQTKRAVSGDMRVFVIAANSITNEAQNTLLKMFEEPREGVHFFFLLPSANMLLPTLRSRLFVVSDTYNIGSIEAQAVDVEKFLQGKIDVRLKLVEPIIKEKDKEKTLQLLNGIEKYIHDNNLYKDPIIAGISKDILNFRAYLRGSAPSVKMILEYIMLALPQIK